MAALAFPPRRRTVCAAAAALLAACGGGEALLALLPIVGPIGGSWVLDASPDTPQIAGNFAETFNFGSGNGLQSSYTVDGDFSSAGGNCAGNNVAVRATLNDDSLVINRLGDGRQCLAGRFTDVRTLEVSPTQRYRNSFPLINLGDEAWVNADDQSQRFKFTQGFNTGEDDFADLVGCRRIGAAQLAFSGRLTGFQNATGSGPTVALTLGAGAGAVTFNDGRFRGRSEIVFGGSGGPQLTLRRLSDSASPTTCS